MAFATPDSPSNTPPGWPDWLRRNLFSTPWNAVLTVLLGAGVAWVGVRLASWAFTQAQWAVIPANLRVLMVGPYPAEQLWRVWTALLLVCLTAGAQWGAASWPRPLFRAGGVPAWPFGLAALGALVVACTQVDSPSGVFGPACVLALFAGFWVGRRARRPANRLWLLWPGIALPPLLVLGTGSGGVDSRAVGGLLLTLLLASGGIAASFPIGVALAVGRLSSYPIVRVACTACIETVRGTPLLVVLFVSQLFVPLLLGGVNVDPLLRALVGITVFSAAYLAENVRGGVQSLPSGQAEAARALGLSGSQTLLLIVLPQALRAVLPVLAGQFISLLKDTSLVAIIGLSDLTGVTESIRANPQWIGRSPELLAVLGLIYFAFSSAISSGSRRLEQHLATAGRA